MKKLLLILLTVMMGISSLTLSAQNTLTVAEGTATNAYVPVYGLYVDEYLRCQTIYPAGMFDAAASTYGMMGADITGVTYYLSTPAADSWGVAEFVVRIKEVTASTLSTFVDMTDATTVYTGPLDGTQSTMNITFTTPYTYQGGNLLIEVYSTMTGTYKSCYFYGVSSNGSSWQGYSGTSWSSVTGSVQNFIPKTTFTFTGGTAITCRPVQNLSVDESQATPSSVKLNWTDSLNSGATYSVYNMADNSLVQSGITANTYTVTGLDANTEYIFGVESNCSATDASVKMTVNAHTGCGAITELPYTDGFENIPSGNYQMPYCWGRYVSTYTSTATYPYSHTTNVHSGSRSLYIFGTTGSTYSDTMIAVMPQLDVTAYSMNNTRVTFWAKMSSSTYNKNIYVGTMTNPADPTTFALVDSVLVSGTSYTLYSVPMTSAAATAPYVAFVFYKGSGTIYMDDVTLEELPSCFEVSDLAVSGVTSSSVTLQWTDDMNPNASYSIYIVDSLVGNATGSTFTVTGLLPNTTYNFGVESNCPDGDGTVITVSATTSCAPVALPFGEDFSATLSSDACWRGASNITADSALNGGVLTLTSNSQWTYCGAESNGLPGGHYRVNIYGSSCKKWMITPEIDFSNATSPLLTFDAAFTEYSSSSSAPASGFEENASQKFMVLITTNNCQTWTLLSDINLASLASSSYLTQYVDLSAYAGDTVRIALYGQSLVAGGDNNLHVDNILIEESTGDLCLPVTMLTASNITPTEASLSWTGTADSYNVYAIANGDTTFVQNVTVDSLDLDNLTPMTLYTYGICAVCNNTESPISIVTFGTACTAIPVPYTETFETTSNTLGCWSVEGDGNWTFGTGDYSTSTGSFQGSQNAKITHSVEGDMTKLVSPVLDNVTSGLVLDFAYVLRSWSGDVDELRVYARNAADGAWQMFGQYTDATNVWTTQTVTIPGTVYQVAFEYKDNYGYGLGVDSVVFSALTSDFCFPVSALTASDVALTSVTLTWSDDYNSGTTYTIYNMDDNSVVASGLTTTSYNITGLTSGTSYTFGVQSNCSATESGTMVTIEVSTDCPAVTELPYYEGFENGLGCWSTLNFSNDGTPWFITNCAGLSTVDPHGGAYVVSSWSWNSTPMHADAWLISPKFTLPNTTDSLTIAWWEITSSTYPDKYSVLLSTTTKDTAAFTTVLRPYAQAAGTWTIQSADLTAFAGQDVYIAFHHQDYDMNYLLIDDIALYQGAYIPPAPDTLTVVFAVNDATMGTTNPAPGTYQYISGDTVSFNPIANPGYHFTNWVMSVGTEVDTLSSNYVSVYFLANSLMSYGTVTMTALFEADTAGTLDTLIVHIAVNDPTLGTTTPAVGTYYVVANDTLMISATPNTGIAFDGFRVLWNGQILSNLPAALNPFPCIANPNLLSLGEITVMAMFNDGTAAPDSLTLIVNTADATMGTTNPAPGTYHIAVGDTTLFVAVPNSGYEFLYWIESISAAGMTMYDTIYTPSVTAAVTPMMANMTLSVTAYFQVGGTAPCEAPTGLTVTGVTDESITITWDANPNVNSWNIQYGVAGVSIMNATSNTNSFTLSNLTPATTYTIQVQADCGDGNESVWTSAVTATTTVGIANRLENSVTLFPNPAREYVDIRVDGDLNVSMMEVYDVYGKLINTINVTDNMTRINISGLADGMYFVRVTTEEGMVTKTFVKR